KIESRARLGAVSCARRAGPGVGRPLDRRSGASTEKTDRITMARHLKIAAAQLGPLHKSDSRTAAVKRLVNLLREAHGMGAKFVACRELAFTRFFPRWGMEDQAEVDRRYFESAIPSPETQPLFDEAKKLGIGFYIGYAELTLERRRFNTAILVGPDGSI